MKVPFAPVLFAALASFSAIADEAPPACARVSVSFRSDSSPSIDPAELRDAQAKMLKKLADHGYAAKYVSFYAPGSEIPVSRESEILAEAGDADRILVAVEYTDDFFTRNLALRIYKLAAHPPYDSLPRYNGNETIALVHVGGVNLLHRFKKLLGAKEMIDCADLAALE